MMHDTETSYHAPHDYRVGHYFFMEKQMYHICYNKPLRFVNKVGPLTYPAFEETIRHLSILNISHGVITGTTLGTYSASIANALTWLWVLSSITPTVTLNRFQLPKIPQVELSIIPFTYTVKHQWVPGITNTRRILTLFQDNNCVFKLTLVKQRRLPFRKYAGQVTFYMECVRA